MFFGLLKLEPIQAGYFVIFEPKVANLYKGWQPLVT